MIIDKKLFAENALNLFKSGFSCSESILHAANNSFNLALNDTAIKMATGLHGGIGGSKCCCGALTSSAMVISAFKGRTNAGESTEELNALIQELYKIFIKKNKSACCRVLTKSVDWAKPERRKLCECFVYETAEILADIMEKL
jgi:C_GCAxxG_C_C family probable redox protein